MADSENLEMIPILIGSGVSCAGGLPGVLSLSEKAASGFHGSALDPLFREIKELCDKNRNGIASNYEDWVYLAMQVRDHIGREYENPGIIPLVVSLEAKTGLSDGRLEASCDEIIVSILRLVCGSLVSDKDHAAKAFAELGPALKHHSSRKVRFFSLNHDLMLEKYLKDLGLIFYDGFAQIHELDSGRQFSFDRQAFDEANIAILKLHGSINWWRHRPLRGCDSGNPWIYEFIGVELGENRKFERMDETPMILAGTFNKILQYSSPIFIQFLGEFHHTLRCADRFAVCGYGFADKGINSLIVNWMSESASRHLFVFDPNPFDEKRARGAILGKIEDWQNEGRLHRIAKRIGSDISWDNILDTVSASLP